MAQIINWLDWEAIKCPGIWVLLALMVAVIIVSNILAKKGERDNH